MEKIHLDEKRIIGFTAETSNSSPDMQQVINRLWQRFFTENAAEKIEGKLSLNPIGLYSDYAFSSGNSDARNLRYDVTAGFETDFNAAVPAGMAEKLIPAGEYAVFSLSAGQKRLPHFGRRFGTPRSTDAIPAILSFIAAKTAR